MRLSDPFEALSLDVQQRVDAVSTMAAEGKDPFADRLEWEADKCLSVSARQNGHWNGIAFWFKVISQWCSGPVMQMLSCRSLVPPNAFLYFQVLMRVQTRCCLRNIHAFFWDFTIAPPRAIATLLDTG